MNWKLIAGIVAVCVSFSIGYRYADAERGEEIALLREDYASRAASLEADYRRKEEENARSVVIAWEERDRASRDAVRLDADLNRLRIEAANLKRQLSEASGNSCDAERAKFAECASLCARCAELLERGAREFQEVARDKDAIAKLAE